MSSITRFEANPEQKSVLDSIEEALNQLSAAIHEALAKRLVVQPTVEQCPCGVYVVGAQVVPLDDLLAKLREMGAEDQDIENFEADLKLLGQKRTVH